MSYDEYYSGFDRPTTPEPPTPLPQPAAPSRAGVLADAAGTTRSVSIEMAFLEDLDRHLAMTAPPPTAKIESGIIHMTRPRGYVFKAKR